MPMETRFMLAVLTSLLLTKFSVQTNSTTDKDTLVFPNITEADIRQDITPSSQPVSTYSPAPPRAATEQPDEAIPTADIPISNVNNYSDETANRALTTAESLTEDTPSVNDKSPSVHRDTSQSVVIHPTTLKIPDDENSTKTASQPTAPSNKALLESVISGGSGTPLSLTQPNSNLSINIPAQFISNSSVINTPAVVANISILTQQISNVNGTITANAILLTNSTITNNGSFGFFGSSFKRTAISLGDLLSVKNPLVNSTSQNLSDVNGGLPKIHGGQRGMAGKFSGQNLFSNKGGMRNSFGGKQSPTGKFPSQNGFGGNGGVPNLFGGKKGLPGNFPGQNMFGVNGGMPNFFGGKPGLDGKFPGKNLFGVNGGMPNLFGGKKGLAGKFPGQNMFGAKGGMPNFFGGKPNLAGKFPGQNMFGVNGGMPNFFGGKPGLDGKFPGQNLFGVNGGMPNLFGGKKGLAGKLPGQNMFGAKGGMPNFFGGKPNLAGKFPGQNMFGVNGGMPNFFGEKPGLDGKFPSQNLFGLNSGVPNLFGGKQTGNFPDQNIFGGNVGLPQTVGGINDDTKSLQKLRNAGNKIGGGFFGLGGIGIPSNGCMAPWSRFESGCYLVVSCTFQPCSYSDAVLGCSIRAGTLTEVSSFRLGRFLARLATAKKVKNVVVAHPADANLSRKRRFVLGSVFQIASFQWIDPSDPTSLFQPADHTKCATLNAVTNHVTSNILCVTKHGAGFGYACKSNTQIPSK